MLNLYTHTNILTTICSEDKEDNFINSLRDYFNKLVDPSHDEILTRDSINFILDNNITLKHEIIEIIASKDYSSEIVAKIRTDQPFSQQFKKHILSSLGIEQKVFNLKKEIDAITDTLGDIEREGGSVKGTNTFSKVIEQISALNTVASNYKIDNSSKATTVILDPDNMGDKDINIIADSFQKTKKNMIKTLAPLDTMFGGGVIPGNLYLLAGLSSNGKSLVMQNLALYACKNNKPEDLMVDEGAKPCVVFFSYEMSFRQCAERTLSWLGEEIPQIEDNESKEHFSERLKLTMVRGFKKHDLKIPIVFEVNDTTKNSQPNANDVEQTLKKLRRDHNLQPILVVVDYLDRMNVLNASDYSGGAAGSSLDAIKLRIKARECRNVADKFQVPMISGCQLNREAENIQATIEPHQHKVDVLPNFHAGHLASSFSLKSELDGLYFVYKFAVEEKVQDTDTKKSSHFLAIMDNKDRDNKSVYKYSDRDKSTRSRYLTYTNALKNSNLGQYIKSNTKTHMVLPMIGFRLSDTDYAQSIRNFYLNEVSDFVSLESVMQDITTNSSKDEIDADMGNAF